MLMFADGDTVSGAADAGRAVAQHTGSAVASASRMCRMGLQSGRWIPTAVALGGGRADAHAPPRHRNCRVPGRGRVDAGEMLTHMALSFGMTVMPPPPYQRFIELIQLAERQGFEYAWTYDSHVLWQESYALLPIVARETETIKLGHCVTNPGIRDPTITASWYATMQDLSGGRMVMGIGRGDSSRRVVGLKPGKVAEFERRLRMMKDLMNGRQVEWNEKELTLEWAKGLREIPMHVAGYGPKALAVAGRVGDGVIIQLADPQIIQWIMET